MTRRDALRGFLGAAAWLLAGRRRPARAQAAPVAREVWGRIETVGDGVWAVVSTPNPDDRTSFATFCNGGFVAGRERVLVFDAFGSTDGAAWVAEQARVLTGQPATDVVISHHHGDHRGGLSAFGASGARPTVWATASTRDTVLPEAGNEAREMLEAASLVAAEGPSTLDLGGRQVAITPYAGHTASDLIATVDDITFCGDLLWTGLVPNYVHATPIDLDRNVDAMLADRTATMVPGHGPLADADALDDYRTLLDAIEAEGRRSFAAGEPPAEAAAAFRLPAGFEALGAFGSLPRAFEVAFGAWHRQLGR
ncbi:MAG: MBL fold metallo-hydrolase [Acidobacteria bacterium]|nr:MBL fold metallo-hydrolase [Acidobacteriota bacterium]